MQQVSEIDKKEYRISFLVKEENTSPIHSLIEKNGGQINDITPLVKIRLAYPIKRQQFAFSGSLIFTASEDLNQKISAGLKFEPDILRLMTICKPVFEEPKRQSPEDAARARARRRGEKTPAKKLHTELSNEALEKKIEELQ